MTDCPMCKTREALRKAERLIDEAPVFNSPLYDDVLEELINSISSAMSTFGCFCEEPEGSHD